MSDSNWPAQRQKLAWGLKFWLQKLETLHYLGSENKGADQTARMRRLICAFVVRIWHNTRFLMALLISKYFGNFRCLPVTLGRCDWYVASFEWGELTWSQPLERSIQDPAFPFLTGRGIPGTNVLNLIPASNLRRLVWQFNKGNSKQTRFTRSTKSHV